MKKIILILLAISSFSLLTKCKFATQNENDVLILTIENTTSIDFNRFSIRETNKEKWDHIYRTFTKRCPCEDVTCGQHKVHLNKTADKLKLYDIRLYLNDDTMSTHFAIELNEDIIIPFNSIDSKEITSIRVRNITGTDFNEINIGKQGQPSIIYRSYNNFINDSIITLNDFTNPLELDQKYWIQLKNVDISVTKKNLSLLQDGTVTFKPDDDFD